MVPMTYVTQGTIQIEIITGAKSQIRINPVADYSIKLEKEGKKCNYVVFIQDGSKEKSLNAKCFESSQSFTIENHSPFAQHLVDAAVKQIKVEVCLQFKEPEAPKDSEVPKDSIGTSIPINIESIRIPATI